MRLSISLLGERYNLISLIVLVLCFLLTILVVETEKYYLLLLPLVAGLLFIIVFIPDIIPYILIITNFYGGFIFVKSKIAVTITDVFLIILILAFGRSMFLQTRGNNVYVYNKKLINLFITLFIASLLSLFFNISNLNSSNIFVSIWYLIKLIQLPLVFLIFSICHFNQDEIEKIISLCFAFSIIQLPIAFYQYYSSYGYGAAGFRNVHGTLTYNHSMIGTFMLIPLSFCLYRFYISKTKGNKLWHIMLGTFFLLIVILSGTRSSLFGIAFSIIVYIFLHFKFRRTFFFYLVFTCIAIMALYFQTPLKDVISFTFFSGETQYLDLSSMSRFLIWKGSIDHFLSTDFIKKLFGIGMGAYSNIKYSFIIWGSSKSASGAHNNFLHVLCEVGIVGLIIYTLIFYNILKDLYKSIQNPLSKAYFFLTIALLFSSFTQETFWFQKAFGSFWLFYMIFLAIVLQNNQKVEQ